MHIFLKITALKKSIRQIDFIVAKNLIKIITRLLVVMLTFLILGQILFYCIKNFPDLTSDQQGIVNNMAKEILNAQIEYRNKKGVMIIESLF